MNIKYAGAALLGMALAVGVGGTAAQAEPVMKDPQYFFIYEDAQVIPTDQVRSQQDVVGYTDTRNPRPVYRWEQQLQEDTAARDLIQEQLTGRQPDENYDGFFENYYRSYN